MTYESPQHKVKLLQLQPGARGSLAELSSHVIGVDDGLRMGNLKVPATMMVSKHYVSQIKSIKGGA